MPVEVDSHIAALQARCHDFLPPDAFDAHAHLYRAGIGGDAVRAMWDADGRDIGLGEYRAAARAWLGDKTPTGGLYFAFPAPDLNLADANAFVADQVSDEPRSRALMLIRPGDDPDDVADQVRQNHFAGFKVYHIYADRPDTFHADIDEFLPEWAWQLADRDGLALMLHMVKPRALAEPDNQRKIRQRCRAYPNARLILAHAARGFAAHHTREGIESLRGLDNVYFDTSAVCEAGAMRAILETFGPSRLMFGMDFPVNEKRGKCVTVGDGFFWLEPPAVDWQASAFAQPVRVGVESIVALQEACASLHLNTGDVERICRDNALALLGITAMGDGGTGNARYERAKQIIPGGTQLLSKRPEMFAPTQWPAYFREARGCEVIDTDGRRFIDMTTSGIGSCLLGYRDPDVTSAVLRRVELGAMSTLNAPEEVELAERLLALHPWAEQARFARTGGEAMSIAVRLARAATGRERVAFCGYHGWSDWYLAANLSNDALDGHLLPGLAPAGVPRGLAGTALPFHYNRLDELEALFDAHADEFAAVVMEPTRSAHPEPGFLEGVRKLCDRHGAVLVLDEITAGWRFACGGAHLIYDLQPDIAVFAKALGNGHPIAAVIGRASIMDGAQRSFISSTYWTESVGPVAALATLEKMQSHDVSAHVHHIGERMRTGWHTLGERHGLPMRATGHAPLLHLGFEHDHAAAIGTLFTTRMLSRGYLAGAGFYPTLAHTERHVDDFCAAADRVLPELAEALTKHDIDSRLNGPVRHTGFARLT